MNPKPLNPVARIIWLVLNILFGASFSFILFYWVAADMKMPHLIVDFISSYVPWFSPIFQVPYVKIASFSSSLGAKLAFNAVLYAIFGVAHTVFAQEHVQVVLNRILFPQQTLRTAYCIMVSVTALLIMGFWQHTNVQLWNLLPRTMSDHQQQNVLLILFNILYLPGWHVGLKFNIFEFCGIKQLVTSSTVGQCPFSTTVEHHRTTGVSALVTSGLFRLCRHPMYLFTLIALTITPVMSLDRLVFILYTCIYAYFGIPIEERKLIQIFGQAYIDYQQRVPAVIPFTQSFSKSGTKSKQK